MLHHRHTIDLHTTPGEEGTARPALQAALGREQCLALSTISMRVHVHALQLIKRAVQTFTVSNGKPMAMLAEPAAGMKRQPQPTARHVERGMAAVPGCIHSSYNGAAHSTTSALECAS